MKATCEVPVVKCQECNGSVWQEFAWERKKGRLVCRECMTEKDCLDEIKAKAVLFEKHQDRFYCR